MPGRGRNTADRGTGHLQNKLRLNQSTIYSPFPLTGQHVAERVAGHQQAGRYAVTFDGSGYVSGVYLYRLESGGYLHTRRMVLIK